MRFLSHLFQYEFKSASVWSKAGLSSKAIVFLPSLLNRLFLQKSLTFSFLSYLGLGAWGLAVSGGLQVQPKWPWVSFVLTYVFSHVSSCCYLFIPVFILPKAFLQHQCVFLETEISQTIQLNTN